MPYPTEKRGAAPLDDGLIQTLYGVSLELEGAAEDVTIAPDAARARIEIAIDRLAEAMRDVRRAVHGPDVQDALSAPATNMLNDNTSLRVSRPAGVPEREEHHV